MQSVGKLDLVECRGRGNGVPHDTPRGKPNTRKPKGETYCNITRRYTCGGMGDHIAAPITRIILNSCPLAFFFVLGFPLGAPFSDHAGNYLLSRSGVRSGVSAACRTTTAGTCRPRLPRVEDYHPTSRKSASLGKTCRVCAIPLRLVCPKARRLSGYPRICPLPLAALGGKFSVVPFSDHAAEKQHTVGRRQACNIRAFAARG